jgi:hypothetical protein
MPDIYQFDLVQRGTVVDTHDLLSQMRVVVGSWRETPQGSQIVTTCTLAKKDTAANIRAAVADLRTFLRAAMEFTNDPHSLYECWYRWQTPGESAKRSLVYGYRLEPLDGDVEDIHLDSGTGRYLLTFTREAAYEETTAQTFTSSSLSSVGGRYDLTSALVGGDLDGRIEKLIIKPSMTGTGANLYRAWVGVRPPRYGIGTTSFGFNPQIDIKTEHIVGGLFGSSISTVSGSYVGGYLLRDDFSDGADLSMKYSCGLVGVEYYIGSYLVLLRARLTNSSTICSARVSTSYGGYSAGAYAKPIALGNTQYIESNAWRFYEMGVIDIPGGRVGHIQSLASFNINLETGRLSGSASFDADCLVLIPAERYITWTAATFGRTASTAGNIANAYVYTQPGGGVEGLVVNTDGAPAGTDGYAEEYAAVGTPGKAWSYPYDGGCLVFAGERETAQTMTDTAALEIFVKRRWELYRT